MNKNWIPWLVGAAALGAGIWYYTRKTFTPSSLPPNFKIFSSPEDTIAVSEGQRLFVIASDIQHERAMLVRAKQIAIDNPDFLVVFGKKAAAVEFWAKDVWGGIGGAIGVDIIFETWFTTTLSIQDVDQIIFQSILYLRSEALTGQPQGQGIPLL